MAKPSPSYSGIPDLKALGRAIREERLRLGYSQESFADQVDIDRSYIGGIERGEHNLALVNLIKICRGLGIAASEILTKAGL